MAKSNKKTITKENWVSSFTLIGKPKINDFTFKIDEHSNKSAWIYNSMNLGIDCGEKHGVVYAEMMGGYSDERENFIYAHGKDDDGRDDFSKQMTIDWDYRFDDDILSDVGDLCFITVGLQKTTKGQTYYKKFLSEYDAIAYIKEYITDDMVVNVRGTMKYSTYNGQTQVRKQIQSIALSKVENPEDFVGKFTQSVLIDKNSATLKNRDTDKGVIFVDCRVLDYIKEYNGVEVKGQFPYDMTFEYAMDFSNQDRCKKIMDKLFKVKKDVTQITFEGEFIEGGATVTVTVDDIPDDIKELIDLGIYSEEEAIAKCSTNGSRERRMVLTKPMIKNVANGEETISVLQVFPGRYAEEDLLLDCMNEDDADVFDEDDSDSYDGEELDWLNEL